MFNFDEVITGDYDVLPAGEYPAYVEKAEWKTSKAGAEYLNIMFKIIGEKHAGRVLFKGYNLFHDKENVRNIALGEVKRLLQASGLDKMKFSSKEDLVESVLQCRVNLKVVVKKSEQYGDQNEIKGYKLLSESSFDVPDSSDIPF